MSKSEQEVDLLAYRTKRIARDQQREQNRVKSRQQNFKKTRNGKNLTMGLFNYTPYSIGEDARYTRKKFAPRDESGMVKLQHPRQILPGGRKRGSYFQYMGTLAANCTYINPLDREKVLARQLRAKTRLRPAGGADRPVWRPGTIRTHNKGRSRASYKHMKDFDIKAKLKTLNEEGQVKTKPRNILVSPPKKGRFQTTVGHTFSKPTKHMQDEYDRPIKMQKELRKRERMKIKALEQFRPSGPGGQGAFVNHVKTFYYDLRKFPKKGQAKYGMKARPKHDQAMRLGYAGSKGLHIYGTIGKFQKYMANPIKVAKRKKQVENPKGVWRVGLTAANRQWVPTPSVSQNKTNLRSKIMRSMTSRSRR